MTYTPPNPPVPGVWIPTAPTPPIGTYLPLMRPFSLDSADQFRSDGPPALDSKRWARDYNEVKEIGSSTSTLRTADQTLAARFWAEAPVQQAHGTFRKFVLDHQLDVAAAARFMAMISVTYADAIIACFDAKYHYAFWRPITAIRAGDTDGNKATLGDPAWSPLLAATPNHPEYPSAHSCLTPAGGRVMASFLGTKQIDLTVPSLTGLGDRHFTDVDALEYEVGNARIWGGIHFRSAVEDGITIGKRTAHQVLAHHFQRVEKVRYRVRRTPRRRVIRPACVLGDRRWLERDGDLLQVARRERRRDVGDETAVVLRCRGSHPMSPPTSPRHRHRQIEPSSTNSGLGGKPVTKQPVSGDSAESRPTLS